MKRLSSLVLLLLALFLVGCASTARTLEPDAIAIEQALISVVELASQGIDANYFFTIDQMLFPPEAAHFSTLTEIPLFLDRLSLYKDQVLQAYRQTILASPALVSKALERVVWDQSMQILRSGNQSGTNELIKQQGEQLQQELEAVLRNELGQSMITWALVLDRYSIWQRATSLWGRQSLEEVDVDPRQYQIDLFLSVYFRQLLLQEEQLRTTPVIRGSGSFLELFQQDGR